MGDHGAVDLLRKAVVALILAAAWSFVVAGSAPASCASAVVVDGHVLVGTAVDDPRQLPRRGARRRAIVPACNDAGQAVPDVATDVASLSGVPPEVAVVAGRPAELYVAQGPLVALGEHPLHLAAFRSPRRPTYRGRHACRRERGPLRGSLTRSAWPRGSNCGNRIVWWS